MKSRAIHLILAGMLVVALSRPAIAQPAPRRLSFADVATAAVQNNLQLRGAAFEVAVAHAQLAQARGAKMPQVSLSAFYSRSQERASQPIPIPNPFGGAPPVITLTFPAPDPNLYTARVLLQYPLYTGGRLESQIALAEANLRGAQATFERAKQQVVFAVQQTYLQALLAQENIAAAQRALDQANESLRVAEARLSTGAAPRFDVLQAQVAVANAEQGVVRAQTGSRNAQAEANALLNLSQDTLLEFTDTLTPRPVAGTLQDAVARGLRDRPDLLEVRSRLDAVKASIELAASGGRPTVSLGAGYDVNGGGQSGPSLTGLWSVTLGVTLSLFDGGITRERVREAELRQEQLKVLEAQTRQRIELEVRQAWHALEQATGELTAASRAVEQGREAARLAAVRYQSGVGTSLEVLSAQAALAQAELGLASARFGQNLARIRLILAAGSL